MARSRMIRPEFWSDEKIGGLSFMERLLFVGMWNFADDEGLIKSHPSFLKSCVFPYDDSLKISDIKDAICKFEKFNMVYRYKVNGQNYLWIIKFRVYQRIDKPQKFRNPIPSIQNIEFANAIHKRDSWICHLCGVECSQYQIMGKAIDGTVASIDHVEPQSKGGGNEPSNLKTACISCNKSRGNKDLDAFLKDMGRFQEDSKNDQGMFVDETETETESKTETETETRARDKKAKPPVKKFQPPTQDEVVAYFESNGYSADAAIRAYRYYDAGNWKDAKGSQVRNWKQKMVGNWFKDENKDRPQSGSVFQNLTGRDRQNAAVMDEFLRRKEREAASGL